MVAKMMYLKPVDIKGAFQKEQSEKNGLLKKILLNLWPIFLIILFILVFRLNTTLSVYITLILFLIQQKFSGKEL